MFTNLLFPAVALACFVYCKYVIFSRRHITTGEMSPAFFLRFWLKPNSGETGWEHFVDGKGEFSCSEQKEEEENTYGGGISGTW